MAAGGLVKCPPPVVLQDTPTTVRRSGRDAESPKGRSAGFLQKSITARIILKIVEGSKHFHCENKATPGEAIGRTIIP